MLNQTDTIPLCTYTKARYSNMDYFKNFALAIKKIAITSMNPIIDHMIDNGVLL